QPAASTTPALRLAPWLLAAVAAAELLALHRPLLRGAPASLFYPRTPLLAFVERNLGEHRLVGFGPALVPNYAQALGLADVRIDGPSRPADYGRVLSVLQPARALRPPHVYLVRRPTHPLNDLL